MEPTPSINEWLPWLGRVRFLVITFLVAGIIAVRQWTTTPFPVRTLLALSVLWYLLATFYLFIQRAVPQSRWHAPVQIALDLGIITGVVYASGAQDSYFISLYLLAILMGSISVLPARRFLGGGIQFRAPRVRHGDHLLRNHPAHSNFHSEPASA